MRLAAFATLTATNVQLFRPPTRWSPPLCTLHSPFPSPDSGVNFGGSFQASSHPIRTMVFIDGTWLYYSFHGRRPNCPVTKTYGDGWEYAHSIDYDRLPQLISQHLHQEILQRFHAQRFVEVVRTVVFSSMRADTMAQSPRMRMFKGMQEANFEVHLSTTHGSQEKCIDISLAVEMMHYAALPGAYDIAVIVTGDKDFMPALSRIRTQGKRVAICSMRNCCANDLLDPSAHVRDYAPIWLDDHLEYLIRSNADTLEPGAPQSTASELLRLVTDFLSSQGGTASSRDIGRFLQREGSPTGDNMLTRLKARHAGLRAFLTTFPEQFGVDDPEPSATDKEFFVTLLTPLPRRSREQEELLIDAKIGSSRETAQDSNAELVEDVDAADPILFGQQTVAALREECRKRGLRTTGLKRELVDRLRGVTQGTISDEQEESRLLLDTVTIFLKRKDGMRASSRDIGRELASHDLLAQLKARYTGLFQFFQTHAESFTLELPSDPNVQEYHVQLNELDNPP
jgi:uncharacterized LabA/DUF88 family protein